MSVLAFDTLASSRPHEIAVAVSGSSHCFVASTMFLLSTPAPQTSILICWQVQTPSKTRIMCLVELKNLIITTMLLVTLSVSKLFLYDLHMSIRAKQELWHLCIVIYIRLIILMSFLVR